jgi:hypothetical protein
LAAISESNSRKLYFLTAHLPARAKPSIRRRRSRRRRRRRRRIFLKKKRGF